MRIIIILLLVAACGRNTNVTFDSGQLTDRMDRLEARILVLEELVKVKSDLIDNMQLQLDEHDEVYKAIELIIDSLESEINSLNIDATTFVNDINSLQFELANLDNVVQNTVEVVQLCNAGGEVLLKLLDNTLISFSENGNKRYLAGLSDGNYQTTDGENCKFTVSNGEII